MLNRRRICAAVLATTATVVLSAAAQNSSSTPILTGESGKIMVLPNSTIGQTTVVFTSAVKLNPKSNQIVFVAQTEKQSFPPGWSGSGRVLIGDGVLIVAPESEDGTKSGWVFKFADRSLQPSFKNWRLTVFDVYGIARYGESTPLTQGEIDSLAETGKVPDR